MKEFFKYLFASFLGLLLAVTAIVFLVIIGFSLYFSSAERQSAEPTTPHSVLVLRFDEPISDRAPQRPFKSIDIASLSTSRPMGLNEILLSIKQAKQDKNIDAIYLKVNNMDSGWATVEEIRNALIEFKKSKKKIIAYSDVYTQKAYYLASVADKVFLNPEGYLEFRGLSTQYVFFKQALDKLGVEMQILRVGAYKSAVEPFITDKMSKESKLQTQELLSSIHTHFIKKIAEQRKIHFDTLNQIAIKLKVKDAESAQKYHLVDSLAYDDQVEDFLKKTTQTAKEEDLAAVEVDKYYQSVMQSATKILKEQSSAVAVIYASGEIVGGDGSEDEIGAEKFLHVIRDARQDETIKAIVLRINSPGGMALASDAIWREVQLAAQTKPVIASMGDVAASGGYYIACASNKIIAEPTTITGSIGIFGIVPNFKKLLNEKVGLTFDGVKTGDYADLGDLMRPLREDERLILQREVERGYNTFLEKVAVGRKRNTTYIDSIAQGRVWSGLEAQKKGLVDEIGGLEYAVELAAKMANVSQYDVLELPERQNLLSELLSDFSGKMQNRMLSKELGENYRYYSQIKNISKMSGVQARMINSLEVK